MNEGTIKADVAKYLFIEHPKIPTFCTIPKVHKNVFDPPGRPFVSGIDSYISRVSVMVNYYIQPIVHNLPSFLKDTMELLKLLENLIIPEGTILCSVDVKALYSNIPPQQGG